MASKNVKKEDYYGVFELKLRAAKVHVLPRSNGPMTVQRVPIYHDGETYMVPFKTTSQRVILPRNLQDISPDRLRDIVCNHKYDSVSLVYNMPERCNNDGVLVMAHLWNQSDVKRELFKDES